MAEKILPHFIVIGAQKSASTFIKDMLCTHPDIYMPKEETRFFEDPEYGDGDLTRLSALFRGRNEKVFGIKRPDYLGRKEVPGRIYEAIPNAKLIVVLRNPVERLISAYYYYIKIGFVPPININEALPELLDGRNIGNPKSGDLLGYGDYASHLRRYLQVFSKEQIHVILQEDIAVDPISSIGEVIKFLRIDKDIIKIKKKSNEGIYSIKRLKFLTRRNKYIYDYDEFTGKITQKKSFRGFVPAAFITGVDKFILKKIYDNRKPAIDPSIYARLRLYYKDQILVLQDIIGRDLSGWL